MAEQKPIQTVSSKIDWESPYYRVRRDEIRLQDGSAGVYNVLEMRHSAFVVPVLDDGRIVLIRNYRYTLSEWVWEIPAGGMQTGQSPEDAARAELLEEAGGTAKHLRFLLKACTMNGIGDHTAHFFLATGVTLGETQPEKTEYIHVHPMPAEEVYSLIERGEMNDAVSIAALLLSKPYLP